MARKKKLTVKDRSSFALEKSLNALRWVVISDVGTYALLESLKTVEQLQLPMWAVLLTRLIVNISVYAIAKYNEGENK